MSNIIYNYNTRSTQMDVNFSIEMLVIISNAEYLMFF